MVKAVLFDLFETLITESGTRPPGVSSLASELGCEREAFRRHWKPLRPSVTIGRASFQHVLSDIATRLGPSVDANLLQQLSDRRVRTKAVAFEQIETPVLNMLDALRGRKIRLGVVSNCFPEDVVAWPSSSLATRFDCAVFSCEVGLAKPDPEIYREAMRRLQVDPSETWFVGDGGDDELQGAEQAGLRAFKALWFLERWPHFQDDASYTSGLRVLRSVEEIAERIASTPPPPGRC